MQKLHHLTTHTEQANLTIMEQILNAWVREQLTPQTAKILYHFDGLTIKFSPGERLSLHTRSYSLGQFDLLDWPRFQQQTIITVEELLQLLGKHSQLEPEELRQLQLEFGESRDNLALALGAPKLDHQPKTLIDFEQSVIFGHPLHPGSKLRKGMSQTEQKQWAGEWRKDIQLPIVKLPVEYAEDRGGSDELSQYYPELKQKDIVYIPVHPWQAKHILPTLFSDLKHNIQLAETTIPVRASMSLRTMIPLNPSMPHVKTAIGVQTTGATRTVSKNAAHNGPEISQWLNEVNNNPLSQQWSKNLTILSESHSTVFYDPNDPEDRRDRARFISVIYRQNPNTVSLPTDTLLPAAALLEPGTTHQTIFEELLASQTRWNSKGILDFVHHYTRLLIPACLSLLSQGGIAIEAHLQNTVVYLDGNLMPRHFAYRDFGGVRVLPEVAKQLAPLPMKAGSATLAKSLSDAYSKLVYALFQNHLGEWFRSIARYNLVSEQELWSLTREQVLEYFSVHPDLQLEEFLLNQAWHLKCMTTMRLKNWVTDYPYSDIPNPLHR